MNIERMISLFLVVVILFGCFSVTAFADEVAIGEIGKTVYLSLIPFGYNYDDEDNFVEGDKQFALRINFYGNPTQLDESIQSVSLCISFDGAKVSANNDYLWENKLISTDSSNVISNVVAVAWASQKGIAKKNSQIYSDGTLGYFLFTAKSYLTAEDLSNFKIITNIVVHCLITE